MGRQLVVADHLTTAELKARYLACREAADARRWQAVWLVAQGHTGAGAAALVGSSGWAVGQWVHKYNADGPEALLDGRRNNGRSRLLSPEQEAELARRLEGPAPDGGLWSGPKVARLLAEWLERPVHDAQAWRIIRRLGFRLKQPRQRHPEADPEAQAAFKKGALRNR